HHQCERDEKDDDLHVRDDDAAYVVARLTDEGRKRTWRGGEEKNREVLQKKGNADRRDERREAWRITHRPVRRSLAREAERRSDGHRSDERERDVHWAELVPRLKAEPRANEDRRVRAHHEHFAVSEVDEPEHAVHHRVAERDEGVDRPDAEP